MLHGGEDDEPLFSVRVGIHCRIVYAIRDRELLILVARVAHRREVYRRP